MQDGSDGPAMLDGSLKISCRMSGFPGVSTDMIYRFGTFRLDPDRFELFRDWQSVAMEPQVFQFLLHLIRHRDRMVSKDEIVAAVWNGRAISDASISSRVRLARGALGDDGARQAFIRTVHGRGFRFVAPVTEEDTVPAPVAPMVPSMAAAPAQGRPSIAVLPLQAIGLPDGRAVLADAISHDVIQALSRLRWLTVIARGSSFRFRGTDPDLPQIGTALSVRYILFGLVEAHGGRLSATLELADSQSGAVIWADRLTVPDVAVEELRQRIVAGVIGAMDMYIPLNEAMAAAFGNTEDLDAWSSYHLGLHHMYRFTATNNARATALFEQAVRLDPRFARAHAGLSFTRFQDCFMRYGGEPREAALAARRHAERGLELDPLDPFANFTMGRSFWLTGEPEAAANWLERATRLNPNYAQGFYAQAFTAMLIGDHAGVERGVHAAVRLSPLDPMLYGMLGTRAHALIHAGRYAEAAEWGDRAATAPGAHFLIAMIALVANSLAGREDEARRWLADVRHRRPDASGQHFFAAFPFRDAAARKLIRLELEKYGL
jgi:TolB-like protein/tetratricopeptide (TPR) repeat protein